MPRWQRLALRVLGHLPQHAARSAISRFEAFSGLDPRRLENLSVDDLARERLRNYQRLVGPFPAVITGAALGASAHLALALGGPFLPQTFVTTLRGGSQTGDARIYFQRSADLARRLAAENPGILTIQHYDPVHDGWMTRFVNHLRFKLVDLPPAYQAFIRRSLEPGGAVVFLDCGAQWLRYQVGERSLFQVGGWGEISAQEFLEGSPRLDRYCQASGLHACDWRLPEYPVAWGPESEWGCEPGLGEALQAFCEQEGYRFVRIRLPEPHDFSRLAFSAVARLLEHEGRPPAGVFIEMFSQFDPHAVMQAGLLPVWLVFNTWDSLQFLTSMRPHFPQEKPVFFSPLSTFTLTPDLVPWESWIEALSGLDWRNVGTRPSHYPADALALTRWAEPLRDWVAENYRPMKARLAAEELFELNQATSSEPL